MNTARLLPAALIVVLVAATLAAACLTGATRDAALPRQGAFQAL